MLPSLIWDTICMDGRFNTTHWGDHHMSPSVTVCVYVCDTDCFNEIVSKAKTDFDYSYFPFLKKTFKDLLHFLLSMFPFHKATGASKAHLTLRPISSSSPLADPQLVKTSPTPAVNTTHPACSATFSQHLPHPPHHAFMWLWKIQIVSLQACTEGAYCMKKTWRGWLFELKGNQWNPCCDQCAITVLRLMMHDPLTHTHRRISERGCRGRKMLLVCHFAFSVNKFMNNFFFVEN